MVVPYYVIVALVLPSISWAHYHENPQSTNARYMSRFSQVPGVMVSFDHPVLVKNKFKGIMH